jgi:hypothetical protein
MIRLNELPRKLRGLYLVYPHGTWVVQGLKKGIVKSKRFGISWEPLALVEDHKILGVIELADPIEISSEEFRALEPIHRISQAERKLWWGDKEPLFFYPVEDVLVFPEPIPYDPPQGAQVIISEVEIPVEKLRKKSETQGEFVLQLHEIEYEEGMKPHWDIRISLGFEFNVYRNPASMRIGDIAKAKYKTCQDVLEWMGIQKPRTKKMVGDLTTYVTPLDRGEVEILHWGKDHILMAFHGMVLKGTFRYRDGILQKEKPRFPLLDPSRS